MNRFNILLISLAFLGLVIYYLLHLSAKDSNLYTGFSILIFVFLFGAGYFWSRLKAGQLLFRLLSKGDILFYIIFFLALGGFSTWAGVYLASTLSENLEAFAVIGRSVAIPCFTALMFFSCNSEFRAKGIFYYGNLLSWDTILSYQWHAQRQDLLQVKTKNLRSKNTKIVSIRVPPNKKEAIQEILSRHIPNKELTRQE